MTRAVSDNAPSCSKALLCALIAFTALTTFAVYWPGLSGPFLFNDYPKILQNNLLKITSLSLENVSRASSSLESGPLRRPVAALSFATNHYFAGSFDSPFTLKATNLVIHILTALTIFWFAYLVVNAIVVPSAHDGEVLVTNARLLVYIAGVTTALWVVHPIQLTSVLYVLQRMASLSALFVFLALVDYVYARQFARAGRMCASVTCFGLAALLAVCGLLSKENAILVLIFVVLTELSLFRDTGYRCKWQMSTRWRKALLITALLTAAIIVLVGSVHYAMPADALRPFLMLERLFTEPRALVFYLSLILLPRSSAFGLFHDDLELSTSLLNPWTTIASIALLVVLIVAAIRLRHRHHYLLLVSFGSFVRTRLTQPLSLLS